MSEANINLTDPAAILSLFGPQDQYLKMIRNHYGVAITHRDGKLKIVGEEAAVRHATSLMEALHQRPQQSGGLTLQEVQSALGGIRSHAAPTVSTDPSEVLPRCTGCGNRAGIAICWSAEQQRGGGRLASHAPQDQAEDRWSSGLHRSHTRSRPFPEGPAGCGKTYLAVA